MEFPNSPQNEERGALARQVREERKERDELRSESNTAGAKIRDLLGWKESSSALNTEADLHHQKAKRVLNEGKEAIANKSRAEAALRIARAEIVWRDEIYPSLGSLRYESDVEVIREKLNLIQKNEKYLLLLLEQKDSDTTAEILSSLALNIGALYRSSDNMSEAVEYLSGLAMKTLEEKTAQDILSSRDALRLFTSLIEAGGATESKIEEISEQISRLTNDELDQVALSELVTVEVVLFERGHVDAVHIEGLRDAAGRSDLKQATRILALCLLSQNPSVREFARKTLSTEFQTYGFTDKEIFSLLDTWELNGGGRYHEWVLTGNLEKIKSLEEQEPGISRFLFKICGIKEFRRYPTDLLLKQKELSEDTEIPYGLALFSSLDVGESTGGVHSSGKGLSQLYEQLRVNHVRIIEVSGKRDLLVRTGRLKEKYPKKASFIFASAHGFEWGMHISPKGSFERTHLLTTDFEKPGINVIGEVVKENGPILLSSCSTGAEYGFAQRLSEALPNPVIAPDSPASLGGLELAEAENGDIDFKKVEFKGSGGKEARVMQYRHGEMMEE